VLLRPGRGRRAVIATETAARPFAVLLPRSVAQYARWRHAVIGAPEGWSGPDIAPPREVRGPGGRHRRPGRFTPLLAAPGGRDRRGIGRP
jgi:hypothetical protein